MEYYAMRSDSEQDINQIVELARKLGVDYTFITDEDFERLKEMQAARPPKGSLS